MHCVLVVSLCDEASKLRHATVWSAFHAAVWSAFHAAVWSALHGDCMVGHGHGHGHGCAMIMARSEYSSRSLELRFSNMYMTLTRNLERRHRAPGYAVLHVRDVRRGPTYLCKHRTSPLHAYAVDVRARVRVQLRAWARHLRTEH